MFQKSEVDVQTLLHTCLCCVSQRPNGFCTLANSIAISSQIRHDTPHNTQFSIDFFKQTYYLFIDFASTL